MVKALERYILLYLTSKVRNGGGAIPFIVELPLSLTILQSHDQLRKYNSEWIQELIHKLFQNYWPSPQYFEGLNTTVHI